MKNDLISRRKAINTLEKRKDKNAKGDIGRFYNQIIQSDIDHLKELPSAEPQWIPCSERLPECEQEVLICTEKIIFSSKDYIDSLVTPAIYEDGTMREIDSEWRWEDINYAGWDEEKDSGIIPEGWFENRHFNPDDVYNNPVDRKVVAWMPLPEPWKDGEKDRN